VPPFDEWSPVHCAFCLPKDPSMQWSLVDVPSHPGAARLFLERRVLFSCRRHAVSPQSEWCELDESSCEPAAKAAARSRRNTFGRGWSAPRGQWEGAARGLANQRQHLRHVAAECKPFWRRCPCSCRARWAGNRHTYLLTYFLTHPSRGDSPWCFGAGAWPIYRLAMLLGSPRGPQF
jgi:hypothetical protein